MTPAELNTAVQVTDEAGFYHIALALDEYDQAWFHVVEWDAEQNLFVSIYRASDFEDAQDVLSIYS